MPKNLTDRRIERIIDANINRLKEGLRVCEEISRFIIIDKKLTAALKGLRHRLDSYFKRIGLNLEFMRSRDSLKDIGKNIYVNELKRNSFQDIFFANIQRAKESTRVLEEFSKLSNINQAVRFKDIRYALYAIEKKAARKILSLRNYR